MIGVAAFNAIHTVNLFCCGNQRQFVDGSSATADENYIRQSILQPQSQIVQGYNNVNMPPFRFSDRQLDAIIAYMRSLNE